jgi:hypothetical protein
MAAHPVRVLVFVEKRDAGVGERRPELILHHLHGALANGRQLLRHGQAVGRDLLEARALALAQRRHPDHEELVQVRADDREKLDALEQRMVIRDRLIEHALVEFEPAKFPVGVQRRIVKSGCAARSGSGEPRLLHARRLAVACKRDVTDRRPQTDSNL